MWATLADMYGARFVQTYGDRPGPMWRKLIESLTDEQLQVGIDRLMAEGGAFVPTLPQFSAACVSNVAAVTNEAVEVLAYEMIPSFERGTLARAHLDVLTKRNAPRARALLEGTATPTEREKNVMRRVMPTSLVAQ